MDQTYFSFKTRATVIVKSTLFHGQFNEDFINHSYICPTFNSSLIVQKQQDDKNEFPLSHFTKLGESDLRVIVKTCKSHMHFDIKVASKCSLHFNLPCHHQNKQFGGYLIRSTTTYLPWLYCHHHRRKEARRNSNCNIANTYKNTSTHCKVNTPS